MSDYKVVVLCILAATTFWVLNALNKNGYNTIVDQPIRFYYDEESFMAVRELPEKIKIEITGNGWDLLSKYFQFKVTPYTIELADPSQMDYLLTRNFQRDLSETISPTQLTAILADTLWIDIDRIISEEIKVELDTAPDLLAPNFRFISTISLDPSTVNVVGPGSVIEKLEGRIMLKLDEKRIDKDYSETLELTLPEYYQPFLFLEENRIRVEFDVVQFLEGNKRLKIKKLNFPKRVTVENEDATVIMNYRVDEREVLSLKDLELEAVLNYANRNREDSTVEVRLSNIPKYLESITFEPDKFKLIYD